MEKEMTEDQKLRMLREEVVNLRKEGPTVILQLMEQVRHQEMENMKNAEYKCPVQTVEKKPDFWIPSMKQFEIAEPGWSIEKHIELNARCDQLIEALKMQKESKNN